MATSALLYNLISFQNYTLAHIRRSDASHRRARYEIVVVYSFSNFISTAAHLILYNAMRCNNVMRRPGCQLHRTEWTGAKSSGWKCNCSLVVAVKSRAPNVNARDGTRRWTMVAIIVPTTNDSIEPARVSRITTTTRSCVITPLQFAPARFPPTWRPTRAASTRDWLPDRKANFIIIIAFGMASEPASFITMGESELCNEVGRVSANSREFFARSLLLWPRFAILCVCVCVC